MGCAVLRMAGYSNFLRALLDCWVFLSLYTNVESIFVLHLDVFGVYSLVFRL